MAEKHKSVTLEMIVMKILVIRARCLSLEYRLQELPILEKRNKYQFVDIYVLIRCMLIFLALCFHSVPPFWLQTVITILIVWAIIGSLFHPLAVVIVDKAKVYSFNRSVILLFVNYFEIIIGFAYLYLHLGLVAHSDCANPITSGRDALYFSVVTITTLGYGDMRPINWLGKLCASVEPIIGIILVVVVFGLFLSEHSKHTANTQQTKDEQKQ